MAEEPPECRRYREISRTSLATIRQLDDLELERRFDELMTVAYTAT